MSRPRVVLIDDSALMRRLLREILESGGLDVVGGAADPLAGWAAIQKLAPDVITLDVEMPRMDGLAFLEKLMRARPMPVVMVSSLTERGCETTLRALELGAIDFVTKPKIDVENGTVELADELIAKVTAAARARPRPRVGTVRAPAPPASAPRSGALIKSTEAVIAMGSSTGGTEALRELLTAMPANAPGIVIVQHMPEHFTRQLASRLNQQCQIEVREACDGDRIGRGLALIAPGGARHMEVLRQGATYLVRLVGGPPVNHHRPSVDVLFRSCARYLGANAVGIILTGMGDDGARGLLPPREAGAHTIAQDEVSCVVFGMPREAIACGAAEHVAPLGRIADAALRMS